MTSIATTKGSRVRPPAVAGIFYPGGATQLAACVDELLQPIQGESRAGLRALIVPHAGYRYSGQVAASGYARLRGMSIERVLLLGPSHRVAFRGVALPDADVFETPLGRVRVTDAPSLITQDGLFIRSNAAHEEEHALEVQLPFLQRVLPHFSLTPLVFGDVDERAVAEALGPWFTPGSLLLVSSDLSHYEAYDRAVQLDRATIDHILQLEPEALHRNDACGRSPIRTLLHLAQMNRWKPCLIDYKNSGDTAGDKHRVVGYAAIGFYE